MDSKQTDSNIFDSVVLEPAADAETNTVLAIHLVLLVVPVSDEDVKGSGLNQ